MGASRTLSLLAGAMLLGGLAGCGSGSETTANTLSVLSTESTGTAAAPAETTPTTTRPAVTKPPARRVVHINPGATGGATAPSGSGTSGAAGIGGATAVVARAGYDVANPADYRASQTLRVVVGVRHGSADARTQRAFFFLGDRYLGNDTRDTSASIAVVAQSDTSVTLRYGIYKPGEPLCCPSSTAQVTYTLDNGRLSPPAPSPARHSATAGRRRTPNGATAR